MAARWLRLVNIASVRGVAACAWALFALLLPAAAFGQAAHQVSVSFSPRIITVGQTATLTVSIRNPQGGGNRTGLAFTLALPSGLTTPGLTVQADCYENGTGINVVSTTTTVSVSGLTLRPGGTCTIDVIVLASAAGQYEYAANSVNVNSNGGSNGNAAGTSLTVNASPQPTAQLSAASLAFGSQVVGTTSAAQTVTLSNTGGSALAVNALAVSGDFTASGCAAPASLAAGASCTLSIAFKPTAAGARSGSVQIDTAIGARTVSLSGTGTAPIASLSPARVDFGSVVVGADATASVTLQNTGTAALAVSSIGVSGSFFSQSNGCGTSLAAGASCSISIRYAPGSIGAHSGALSVHTDAAGSPSTVALSGTAVAQPAPAAGLSRTSIDFGSQAVGSTSLAQSVTLSNTGNAPLAVESISVSGDYSVSGCAAPSSIAAGASCTLSIAFRPAATGSRAGSVSIVTNAAGSPHVISLLGSGTAPGVSLSPSPLNFASLAAGSRASAGIVLTNTGTAPLSVAAIAASGSFFSATAACPASLAPGASCTITVTYAPASAGSHSGQVSVQTNAQAAPYVVALFGTATPAPQAAASLSRTSVDFGSQAVGSTSLAQSVTLSNTGDAPLAVESISVSGDYSVSGCAAPSSIAAGASCTLSIAFRPTATGSRAGSVSIVTNAAGSPHVISLLGSGTAPGVSLSPSPLNFASLAAGSRASAGIVLTNTGTAPLSVAAIAASGSFFSATAACPASLAPGASCTITVTYAPASAGSHSGQVSVQTNAQAAPYVVALFGTATPAPQAAASLSRTSIDFGSQLLGTSSAPQQLVIASSGNAPLSILALAIAGDFSAAGCAAGSQIAAGGSCVLSVTFLPSATGTRSGSLQIATNAPDSPHTVTLGGTGFAQAGVAFAPASLAFGSIATGASALLRTEVTNTGLAPLEISSISVAGAAFSQTNTCPATLASGASCDVWVTFAPTTPALHSGELRVASNAPGSPSVAPLEGTATPAVPPRLELSRDRLDFGAQTVGTTSTAQSVTLRNVGTSPLDVLSVSAAGDFGFSGCATPLRLAADASCVLSINFVPTATGPRTGSIAIETSAGPGAITLAGEGTPAPVPSITVTPSSVAFGAIIAGTSIVTHVAVANTGTAALAIGTIAVGDGPFAVAHDCSASLAPNAACDVAVTYAPAAAGAHSGELAIHSNAVPSPVVVRLTGSALPVPAPQATLSRSSVTFAPQYVGTASAAQEVVLTNTGTAPLAIRSIASTGDFGYSGCGYPTTLGAGESCAFAITFKPLGLGARTGAIEIATDATPATHRISLSGTGVSLALPEISLSPWAVGFGPLRVGSRAEQRMRMSNGGVADLEIAAISLSSAHFTHATNCPAVLPRGAECEITVVFAPSAVGAHGAQLRIDSNAVPSPYLVSLSGTGVAARPPLLEVASLVDFGQQVAGTTERRTLELRNGGEEPLVISRVALLGSGAFAAEGACALIAPAQACALTLVFTPPAAGAFGARLDIVSNHAGGVVQVDLSGTGIPEPVPDLELSVNGLGYGNQVVGTASAPRFVRLTSTGSVPVRLGAITATYDFVVDAGQCPALLQPGSSCDVSVAFRPFVAGPRLGRLTIGSNAAGAPDSVSLSGVGCRFFSFGAARNPDRLCAP